MHVLRSLTRHHFLRLIWSSLLGVALQLNDLLYSDCDIIEICDTLLLSLSKRFRDMMLYVLLATRSLGKTKEKIVADIPLAHCHQKFSDAHDPSTMALLLSSPQLDLVLHCRESCFVVPVFVSTSLALPITNWYDLAGWASPCKYVSAWCSCGVKTKKSASCHVWMHVLSLQTF